MGNYLYFLKNLLKKPAGDIKSLRNHMQSQKNPDKEGSGHNANRSAKNYEETEGGEERLQPKPEVPRKNSPMMQTFKKVGYSVWLIVMIVGGVLAFFTFIFLL